MWDNAYVDWTLVVLLTLALVLLIRHGLRLDELARDNEDETRRRDAETAVFIRPADFPEKESGEVTDMVSVTPPGGGLSRWVPRLPGVIRDRKRRPSDDATRVLEPISAPPAPVVRMPPHSRWEQQDTGLMPVVRRKLQVVTETDELGEWEPTAHEVVEPTILGDVLSWRKWKTVRPEHVGMGSLK